MALNDDAKNRLYNWKFHQVEQYFDEDTTEEEKEIVRILNRMFGSSGWFEGDMGTLVSVVVESLLSDTGREEG